MFSFWLYIALFAIISILALILVDPALGQERLAPGGRRPGSAQMLPFLAILAHWILAGLDHGRFHWSDNVPFGMQIGAFAAVAVSLGFVTWAPMKTLLLHRCCASRPNAVIALSRQVRTPWSVTRFIWQRRSYSSQAAWRSVHGSQPHGAHFLSRCFLMYICHDNHAHARGCVGIHSIKYCLFFTVL